MKTPMNTAFLFFLGNMETDLGFEILEIEAGRNEKYPDSQSTLGNSYRNAGGQKSAGYQPLAVV